jgi:phage I-like protein
MGDVPGDYGHALLYEYDAKASGWGKRLEAREDGAWLEVEWTPAAKAAIEAREFRFISPVILYQYTHPESGAEMGTVLHSFALTNTPFFKLDLQPLTATSTAPARTAPAPSTPPAAPAATNQEKPMWRTLLLASLKLASDISDDALKAAAEQHFTDHTTLVTATRKALKLADDADFPDAAAVEGQLVAATSRAGFVPLVEVEQIRATAYAEGQQAGTAAATDPVALAKAKAGEAIEAALQRGAITAATREHWDALAESDPEQCARLVASLPDGSAVPTGASQVKAGTKSTTITAANKPKDSKLTDEQWIAAEQKRDAQRAARKGEI